MEKDTGSEKFLARGKTKLNLLLYPDQRAARMAALTITETATVMISRFFLMVNKKGK
jgi:hypothetical protein